MRRGIAKRGTFPFDLLSLLFIFFFYFQVDLGDLSIDCGGGVAVRLPQMSL